MNLQTKNPRWVAALGAVLLAMGLAACAGDGTSATSKTGAAPIDVGTGEITPKDTSRIAYMVQAGKTFSYTAAQAQGALDAAEELGVTVDVYYSNLDPGVELSNFNQIFPTGKYGGLIIQAVNQQLCKTIAEGSIDRHMLVEVVGNPLCDQATAAGDDLWSPGTMTYMGGQNGVDGITSLLEASAETLTGPQQVLLAMGIDGHPSTVAWEAAFEKFQETHPDWTLANETFTDFTTPGAFAAVQNSLQGNPDVSVIYSLYVDVTAGVVKAVDAQGLGDKIKVFDNGGGSKVSVEFLENGQMAGSLPVYPYSLGYEGVSRMVDAFNGTQPPKFIPGDGNPDAIAEGMITPETVGSFEPQW